MADQPVIIQYPPLEYRLARRHDRLAMQITNPTEDQIALLGNKSSVVDPEGESHPLHGRVIGPHSFARMLLPPIPMSFPYPDYTAWGWGWGWGWGPYDPLWGPSYGSAFYGPPPVSYYRVFTPYDWTWKEGVARLHLTYERKGAAFEHTFEILRERAK